MPEVLPKRDDLELDLSRYELRRGKSMLRLEKIPMELLILLVECVFRRCGWSIPARCEWSFRPCE